MIKLLVNAKYPMYFRDREGRSALGIGFAKDTPAKLLETLIKYFMKADFSFTMRSESPQGECKYHSLLEEIFANSPNLKRDLNLLKSLGCIKGLTPV
jgi:hypothetical protein